MTLILLVIFVALVFEYINGFHDTANSIATVVSTKVLTPRQAVALAAATNLLGALWGTAVAKTIASGLVDTKIVSSEILICARVGAIAWNLCWCLKCPAVGYRCISAVGRSPRSAARLPARPRWWATRPASG